MKSARHQKIVEILQQYHVENQEELQRRLREAGFPVTQATVSRDVKKLRVHKSLAPDGRYRYVCPPAENDSAAKLGALLADSALSIRPAGNIAAVQCRPGMAQAVCTALDSAGLENIVATLAGDDTIFVLCEDGDRAAAVARQLNRLIGR